MKAYPIKSQLIEAGGLRRLVFEAPHDAATQEAWRKAYHDYLAAMRSLRYLALKGLQNPNEAPEQTALKKDSLERHIKQLELFEEAVVRPLLHDLAQGSADASL